jgi:hypothetical protein
VRLSLSSLGRAFGGLGTLLMVIDFALENQYAKTRPRVAEAQSGRIHPLNVHGIVYVTGREQLHLHILEVAAAICIICFAVTVYLEIRRRKREGETGKNLRSHQ